jgi:Xaa-Pro aminopeptidase
VVAAGIVVPSQDGLSSRLSRARNSLFRRGIDAAALTGAETIRYLSGIPEQRWGATLLLLPEDSVLIRFTPESPSAVDRQIVLEPFSRDQPKPLQELMLETARPLLEQVAHGGTLGVELGTMPAWVNLLLNDGGQSFARRIDVSEPIARQRRMKDHDELAVIRFNSHLAQAAYEKAHELIRPGVSEMTIYEEMVKAVQHIVGGPVNVLGDFASGPGGGARGGAPTGRVLEDGDAYVIDFQIGIGGYWVDLTRTFAVGPPPRGFDAAYELASHALEAAEQLLVSGTPTHKIDTVVRKTLARRPDLGGGDYFHLTGHGVGVVSHEPPWIGSRTDDLLVPGDVVAIEPGLYGDSLRGGLRLEDNYLITEGEPERLSGFWRDPNTRISS